MTKLVRTCSLLVKLHVTLYPINEPSSEYLVGGDQFNETFLVFGRIAKLEAGP